MEKIMSALGIILICICVCLSIAFILVRTLNGGPVAFLLKTLASFSLVASCFLSIAYSDASGYLKVAISLVGIGLLLGLIGDMLLDLKVIYDNDKVYLNSGMLSFGLGHLAYFSAFSLVAIDLSIDLFNPILIAIACAIVLTFAIMLSSKKMKLEFGQFTIQTIIYTFLLTFMTVFSLILAIMNPSMWIVFVGMLSFFLSDIVLSMQYFGGKLTSKPLIAINHTLYYLAQILILAFVILI